MTGSVMVRRTHPKSSLAPFVTRQITNTVEQQDVSIF